MEEQIDVLDEKGNKTGEIKSKSAVHRDGDIHRTVHVWFLNSKNQLLLQRRAKVKINHPDKWDISVAGHISAGQTSVEASVREIQEEIGINLFPTDLEYLFTVFGEGTMKLLGGKNYIDREFQDVYLVRKNLDIPTLTLQKDEVEKVIFIDISEFRKWISEKKKDLVMHQNEYERLIEMLTQ